MPYPDPNAPQTYIPGWTADPDLVWVIPVPLPPDFKLNVYETIPPESAADEPIIARSQEAAHDARAD